MISLRRARSAIGMVGIEEYELEPGQTFGQVIGRHYLADWPAGTRLSVSCDAREVTTADLEKVVPDGSCLSMAPAVRGIEVGTLIVYALVSSALSVGINFAFQALVKRKSKPVDRGDQQSAFYGYAGITTTSGPGFRVPVAYGEVDLGGHIISSNLVTEGFTEILEQVLLLCEGRVEAIGGLTGGKLGEADGLGSLSGSAPKPIPTNLRAHGNTLSPTECECAFRLGEVMQTPLKGGFALPSTIYDVDGILNEETNVASKEALDQDAQQFTLRLAFPSGLYQTTGTGGISPYKLDFEVFWTSPTQGSIHKTYRIDVPAFRSEFAIDMPCPEIAFQGTGPFTVTVVRRTASGSPDTVVSACRLSKVITRKGQPIAYSPRAVIGMRIRATERINGQQMQWRFRVKAKRVRVYDDIHGLSEPLWELPTSGVFSGIWEHPPGRNPAWIYLDMLTAPEAGEHQVQIGNIDLPAIRDWADECDRGVAIASGTEAQHTFDGSFDDRGTFQDRILAVCAAGRAVPVRIGSRWSVKYSYRDGHGRGTNIVPPRGGTSFNQPTSIFTSASIIPGSLKLRRLNPHQRPNVIHYQIVNRDLGFEPDSVAVEDPFALQTEQSLSPVGASRKQISYPGVTRPTHARREGLLAHALARECRWDVEFATGTNGLSSMPGQIIGVEHDALQYDATSEHFGYRTPQAATASSSLYLDHDITVTGSPAWSAFVTALQSEVECLAATVTATAGQLITGASSGAQLMLLYDVPIGATVLRGTKMNGIAFADGENLQKPGPTTIAIAKTPSVEDSEEALILQVALPTPGTYPAGTAIPIGLPLTFRKGAQVAVGHNAHIIKLFEIVQTGLTQEVQRTIRAIEWVPGAYDYPSLDLLESTSGDFAGSAEMASATIPSASGIGLVRSGEGLLAVFDKPSELVTRPSRVYTRSPGSQSWNLEDQTQGRGIALDGLDPGTRIEVAVSMQDKNNGAFQSPEAATRSILVVPEVAHVGSPSLPWFEAHVLGEGLLLRWPQIDPRQVEYVEVRRGKYWHESQLVGRTRSQDLLVTDAAYGTQTYFARPRYKSGLFADSPLSATPVWTGPAGRTLYGTPFVDLVSGAAGTLSNVVYDSTTKQLKLAGGASRGTYTWEPVDLLADYLALWSIWTDFHGESDFTADEIDAEPSADREFWDVLGREPSLTHPGCDFDDDATDDAAEVTESSLRQGASFPGVIGAFTRTKPEMRVHVGGAYGPWIPARTGVIRARKVELRLTLERDGGTHQAYVDTLAVALLV